jgi:hypothetical protein
MVYPELIKHYPESMQIFIKIIHNRIESGKNCLIPFTGATGSGKSLSTISLMIGLYLYRHGNMPSVEYITHHVKFKALDMMKSFNNPDLTKKETWSWDEAGVDAGHKTHSTVSNRVIGWLIQTFRNLQQVVFFTVPSINFLDATVRKMLHISVETRTIDKGKKMCICKPLMLQYNSRQDEIYYHNITFPRKDGFFDVIDLMGIPLPPKEYVDAYEVEKNKFTKNLNQEIQASLQKLEDNSKPMFTQRQQDVLDCFEQGITKTGEIAAKLGLRPQNLTDTFGQLRKKGINIEDIRKQGAFIGFKGIKQPIAS